MRQHFSITYEHNGWVYTHLPSGSVERLCKGECPALSPSREYVAYLREGNLFLWGPRGEVRLTDLNTLVSQQAYFPLRVSWHPSERYLLFTRVETYQYHMGSKGLRVVSRIGDPSSVQRLVTIWLHDAHMERTVRLVSPLDGFARLLETGQMEGASVYEPVFSPDGQVVWFLHQGNLYMLRVDYRRCASLHTPKQISRLGTGLDLRSPGASRWGRGALMLAWDSVGRRLVYWVGRFWGTGVSEWGFLPWRDRKLGTPQLWEPHFAPTIARYGLENVHGCVVDRQGKLWVKVVWGDGFQWMRSDGKEVLPVRSGRPSF